VRSSPAGKGRAFRRARVDLHATIDQVHRGRGDGGAAGRLRTGTEGSEEFVLLEKDLGDQDAARFMMHIAWPDEPAPVGSLRLTTIDYDGPGDPRWAR
jgi:hypothetical protein